MAEVRLNIAGNTDWRSQVKNRPNHDVRQTSRAGKRAIRDFTFNEEVNVNGSEYWFEPDRGSCLDALQLNYHEIGSLGATNSIINFYDYHASVGTEDTRGRFLSRLQAVSTDTTKDGYEIIHWTNYCTKSFQDVRTGLYDYLETYVWPEKCSEIVDAIDGYAQSTSIDPIEVQMNDIVIGKSYFNNIFYLTTYLVAEVLLGENLMTAMIRSIPDSNRRKHTHPTRALIIQLDEAQRHVFHTRLEDGMFVRDDYTRPVRRWSCSPNDLQLRILPLVLFISHWSLVLGSYLAVQRFGSLALSVGD